MGKAIWITLGIVLLIIILVVLGIVLLGNNEPKINKKDVDISSVLSPSEAYAVCDRESCPTESVTVEGNLQFSGGINWLTIQDEDNEVLINLLESDTSLIDKLAFQEKMKLQGEGIVRARLRGKLVHTFGPVCTNAGCEPTVQIMIEPENSEFISEVECKSNVGNCFGNLDRPITAQEAYIRMMNSEICTQYGRKPVMLHTYSEPGTINPRYQNLPSDVGKWVFILESPDGCDQELCYVAEDIVYFASYCGPGFTNLNEEAVGELKSLDELYSDCIEEGLMEVQECDKYFKKNL